MKSEEPMILTERNADHGRLRAVLRDWGYGENEIRVLTEHKHHGFLFRLSIVAKPTAGKTCAAKSGDDVGTASH